MCRVARRDDWVALVLFSVLFWLLWYLVLGIAAIVGWLSTREVVPWVAIAAIPYLVTALIVAPWRPRSRPRTGGSPTRTIAETPEAPPSRGETWAGRIVFGSLFALFWSLSGAAVVVWAGALTGSPPPPGGVAQLAVDSTLCFLVTGFLTLVAVDAWRRRHKGAVREKTQG